MVGSIDKFIHICPSSFLGKDYFNCSEIQESYVFSSSHGWMWELDRKEGWAPNNICFQIVVLEKTLESPLNSREIKPINPKGKEPWILIGRTDAEAEALILWPPYMKSQFIGKDPAARKNLRQEKWKKDVEVVRWHHWFNGHEFEQTQRWWRTGKPGVLQSMGWQSCARLSDWATMISKGLQGGCL